MGEIIQLDKYMIPRPDPFNAEINKCDKDLAEFGLCCMVDGKRVDPNEVYNKDEK